MGYYAPQDLNMTGETKGFQRGDIDNVWLTLHFCSRCGSATHWTPTGRADLDRIGVNMRLFALNELEGIEVRYQDGRAVMSETDEFVTTAIGRIGDGKAF